jgi:hypothetical protein
MENGKLRHHRTVKFALRSIPISVTLRKLTVFENTGITKSGTTMSIR